MMQAVWPDVVVEEKNLTVQISALRRVLDDGRTGPSCIQTEFGRGYRFVAAVTTPDDETAASLPLMTPVAAAPTRGKHWCRIPSGPTVRRLSCWSRADAPGRWSWLASARCCSPSDLARHGGCASDRTEPINEAPRLSLVVRPFEDLSGDPKDAYLLDGITDDLTTDLSHIPQAFVIARELCIHYGARRRCAADRPRTRRTLRAGGQRAQN